jgi:hypothetical protein
MHPATGFDPKRLQLDCQPLTLRFALHHEASVPSPPTVVNKSQKCERLRPPLTSPGVVERRQSAELDQAGLFLV